MSDPTEPRVVRNAPSAVPTELRFARNITVRRVPRSPAVQVLIDGEVFPYFIARESIETKTSFGEPGTVTLTLLAETITVDDRYLEGASDEHDLDHTHDEQPGA